MKNIKNILRQEISEITQIFQKIENQEIDKNFIKLCEESIEAIKKRKKLFFGNGGSAADAQHLATKLTSKYKKIYLCRKPNNPMIE